MKNRNQNLLLAFLASLALIFLFAYWRDQSTGKTAGQASQTQAKKSQAKQDSASSTEGSSKASGLPQVSPDDWELRLVNRDNITPELNPQLAYVDGKPVDARIEKEVKEFLAAAQKIDSREHLISGYRSVDYQKELFDSYVQQEMTDDPSLTEEAAQEKVKTYSQPAGASEHQTGLAIDMSTVDSLNESDPNVVEQLKKLAPKYGFVLRFDKGKSDSTGVDYEDWHFRYVGKASAQYMTDHKLSLEEYIAQLKQ